MTCYKQGVLFSEAELTTSQLQDLADQIGEIAHAAAGYDRKLRLRLELGGKGKLPDEVVRKVNEKLGEISDGLKL